VKVRWALATLLSLQCAARAEPSSAPAAHAVSEPAQAPSAPPATRAAPFSPPQLPKAAGVPKREAEPESSSGPGAPAPNVASSQAPAAPIASALTPRALRDLPPDQLPGHLLWVRNVYEDSRRAVVRIDTEVGTGSGFFFHSRKHVATAFHVVSEADDIFVTFQDGRHMRARVVAFDEEHDVALLELSEAAGAQVLEPYDGPLSVGMQAVAIGHPFSDLSRVEPKLAGLLDWSLAPAMVGAFSPAWIQVAGSVNPGNSGGPLLSADGRVIGLISSRLTAAEGLAFAARVQELQALIPRIGKQKLPHVTFSRDAFEIGWAVHVEEGSLTGLVAGAGVKIEQDFPLRLRLSYVTGTHPPSDRSITLEDVFRIAAELDVGYTFLRYYVSLTAQVGNSVQHDDRVEQRLPVVFVDSSCQTPGCPQRAESVRDENSVWRWLPYAGASVEYGIVRGSYAYMFDVTDTGDDQHRLYAALAF
jgi:S1-C subfamily serine protease